MTIVRSNRNSKIEFSQDALFHVLSRRYNILKSYSNMPPCRVWHIPFEQDFAIVVKLNDWHGVCQYEGIWSVWSENGRPDSDGIVISKPLICPIGSEIRHHISLRVNSVTFDDAGNVVIYQNRIAGTSTNGRPHSIVCNINQIIHGIPSGQTPLVHKKTHPMDARKKSRLSFILKAPKSESTYAYTS